jgi:spore coat polysaccharide biosynthesis protein SpsF
VTEKSESRDGSIKVIIQARLDSTRLHGKILKKVLGKPLLEHMIDRLQFSKYATDILIATTMKKIDDAIIDLAEKLHLSVYRGSENDVLDRYYKAAKTCNAQIIVRLTSDCPLIDPKVTDRVIKFYLDNADKFDFVSNICPPSFPDGLDVEVFPFHVLEKAWREATNSYEREHVTPYIWDNPSLFRVGNVRHEKELHYVERWTLDYEEDFCFIKEVYENLYREGEIFYMEDVLKLLSNKPYIKNINKKYLGVNWRSKYVDDLKTKEGMIG